MNIVQISHFLDIGFDFSNSIVFFKFCHSETKKKIFGNTHDKLCTFEHDIPNIKQYLQNLRNRSVLSRKTENRL